MSREEAKGALAVLPAEIIDHVLSYLTPYELADVSMTCKSLRQHSLRDQLWISFIERKIRTKLTSPATCPSYRDLFIRHNPRWFIPEHRIWYGDCSLQGRLIYAHYDARRGCIEAYQVMADRGKYRHGHLTWDGETVYHSFNPSVQLDMNKPILRLTCNPQQSPYAHFENEITMDISTDYAHRISTTFCHANTLPKHLCTPSTQLWPPLNLPSPNSERSRNVSRDFFRSKGHKPDKLSEVSQSTFRVRETVDFAHFFPAMLSHRWSTPEAHTMRREQMITTYATLPPPSYTPTTARPWQGIWCGDYSGHGCEFLVIQQGSEEELGPLPAKARDAFGIWPKTKVDIFGWAQRGDLEPDAVNADDDTAVDDTTAVSPTSMNAARRFLHSLSGRGSRSSRRQSAASLLAEPDDPPPYRGRLVATKLTGDPHVPCGQITFIAEDLGQRGLVGWAREPIFRPDAHLREQTNSTPAALAGTPGGVGLGMGPSAGSTAQLPDEDWQGARIVKAVGHIANANFNNDNYIPSQLILISEDRLAQYWRPFGQVSFYQRVDLDKLAQSLERR